MQTLDGDITLTKRERSSAWQMRYKIGNKWIRTTTGHNDLDKAKKAAKDAYLRA